MTVCIQRPIRDAIQHIISYTDGMNYAKFRTARMVQDAVIRQFEIIGEAAENFRPNLEAEMIALRGRTQLVSAIS